MRLSATPEYRRLRKHLPFRLLYSGKHLSKRGRAEHEAAHIVASIAVGGVAHFAHVEDTFAGRNFAGDGMFAASVPPASLGIVAVAGMIQNGADKIGVLDANMLFGWLSIHLGPYPKRHPRTYAYLCESARLEAVDIIESYSAAVSACADMLVRGPVLDGRTFHDAFRKHSKPPILRVADNRRQWSAAIRGGDMSPFLATGLQGVCEMVRAEWAARKKR